MLINKMRGCGHRVAAFSAILKGTPTAYYNHEDILIFRGQEGSTNCFMYF